MSILLYLAIGVLTLLGTSLCLPPVIRLCARWDLLDHPGGRKHHRVPVPRFGGIAFVTSFLVVVVSGFIVAPTLSSLPHVQAVFPQISTALSESFRVQPLLFGLLAGAVVMFGVGLVDDLLGERFPVGAKFAAQCVAVAIPVACGIQIEFVGHPVANAVLSFFWILGISNAFNLLDNMDGLAAGVAVSSCFIFFLNAIALEEIFLCLILAALMGALIGFLRFNLHPAKVFMGDGGALFIGFMLSSLTILEHYVSPASSTLFPVLMPPLVLAVPLLDTFSVIAIRLREGRPIYRGDRCHLSHRLVASGLSEPEAVKFLFLLTVAVGIGALHLAHASVTRSLWTVSYTLALAILVLVGIGVNSSWNDRRATTETSARRSRKAAEGL